jgi:BirA family biotin operon repressor/biotin-[acetyl-CoA-carboxylase] ligase
LEIVSFDEIPSTQLYLIEQIRSGNITEPIAVITDEQTDGIGSRNNSWKGGKGNFFVSVAVEFDTVPSDLPVQAASIYFAYIMKESLEGLGEKVWLKWPNDLYINDTKVGGIVTQKLKDFLVVGIGINLKKNKNSYSSLSTDIPALILLNIFLERLKEYPKWKQILSKYKVEFEQHRAYFFHHNGAKMSLENAQFCDDGSLVINEERIYSLR